MSNRLDLLARTISDNGQKNKKAVKVIDSSFDYLSLSDYLTISENNYRKEVRDFVEKQIEAKIVPFVEKSVFPEYLRPLLKQRGYLKHFFCKSFGYGSRSTFQGILLAEFARGDAGVALSLFISHQLGVVISELGSEQQKKKYIPSLIDASLLGGIVFTLLRQTKQIAVPSTGTDKKFTGRLNYLGRSDLLLVVWANEQKNQKNKLESYLVQGHQFKGLKFKQKKPRLSLRILEQSQIELQDFMLSEPFRLSRSLVQLKESKDMLNTEILLCWLITGVCLGVYDHSIRYASERRQFNRPIAGFQLIQQKLVKIMSTTQAMLLVCFRLSSTVQSGRAEWGVIEVSRKWINEQGRLVSRLGRQLFGGNGLLHENYVMRALADIEGLIEFQTIQEMYLKNPVDIFSQMK